jgi:hypothetical protein
MNENLTINKIEERFNLKFNLKFNSNSEETYFFEMFNALLDARVSSVRTRTSLRRMFRQSASGKSRLLLKREITLFDIEICLAALCMLNWPGKTSEYKQQIDEIKDLYYNNFLARKFILNSLRNNINVRFKNIQSRNQLYFFNINDLIG